MTSPLPPYTFVLADRGAHPGAHRHPVYGVWVLPVKSGIVPRGLERSVPVPHTWAWHIQREINSEPVPVGTGTAPRLRGYQQARVAEIAAAHAEHRPGYALAYPTGSGKTYMAVDAVNRIGPQRVLVVSPLSHCRGWRSVITRHGTSSTEWIVVNPERLATLFTLPNAGVPLYDLGDERDEAAVAAGVPLTVFDMVIVDEAQILAHPETLRSRLWRRLIGWSDDATGPTSFTLNLSATAWTTPSETSSAAHLLAHQAGIMCPPISEIETDYDGWLSDRLGLTRHQTASGGWYWADNSRDVGYLTRLLYTGKVGATATRDELGLTAQVRKLQLIDLTADERARYELAWSEFLDAEGLSTGETTEPVHGREQHLRFMQKAAIIKAPYVAKIVVDYLTEGYQVVVPAWLEGSVEALAKAITADALERLGNNKNFPWVVRLTGRTEPTDRDKVIRYFQSGYPKVIVTSVVQAISLHANQAGGGVKGTNATSAPRVTIFGDVIYGGKQPFQAEGRAVRDGQEAPAIYVCAADTTEVATLARTFRKLTNTRALNSSGSNLHSDADITSFTAMADELDDLDQARTRLSETSQ